MTPDKEVIEILDRLFLETAVSVQSPGQDFFAALTAAGYTISPGSEGVEQWAVFYPKQTSICTVGGTAEQAWKRATNELRTPHKEYLERLGYICVPVTVHERLPAPPDTTEEEQGTFTANEFCSGFLAQLVLLGCTRLDPRERGSVRGLHRVIETIDSTLPEWPPNADPWRAMLRIRNRLSPSNVGSFDKFETALRDLMTSIVERDFSLNMPEGFAQSLMDNLLPDYRSVVEACGKAFMEEEQGT